MSKTEKPPGVFDDDMLEAYRRHCEIIDDPKRHKFLPNCCAGEKPKDTTCWYCGRPRSEHP